MAERDADPPGEHTIRLHLADRHLFARMSGPVDGRPVLLIHALGGSSTSWNGGFMAALHATGHQVLRLDLRGAGQSTLRRSTPGTPQLGDHVADVVALLDHVAWSTPVLVGSSFGAVIAEAVARSYPGRCAALMLLSPLQAASAREAAILRPTVERLTARDGFGHPRLIARADRIDFLADYLTALAGSAAVRGQIVQIATDLVDHAADLVAQLSPPDHHTSQQALLTQGPPPACATVVVYGSEDPVLRLDAVSGFAAALPSSRLLILAGAGHADLPPSSWRVLCDVLPLTAELH